ncbi:MAG: hypothetical protein MJZ34_01755 [Paludibacteraceae bacterium]|nr:hypothetical protein [Paludibacteraceae bacterium]
MKKIFLSPILLSLVFVAFTSCGHDDAYDDYHHHHTYPLDDHHYEPYDDHHHDNHHQNDNNTYNYIRNGCWYLISHDDAHINGNYELYIVFTDWEILHYNHNHQIYDSGSYECRDGKITVHYQNGDIVDYYINKACDNELILRTKSGIEFRYVRR